MGSSDRRTIHEILGGGVVADVMLWRRKNVTMSVAVASLGVWVVFEISAYTLLSLASNVFLLLFTILFLWAKSAAILNRPAPALPHLHLSEEMVNQAAAWIRLHANTLLSISEEIAMGRDSTMFIKLALTLLLISVVGSFTDLLTLVYTGVFVALTVPALYERYENSLETWAVRGYKKLQQLYVSFYEHCIAKIHKRILQNCKLS